MKKNMILVVICLVVMFGVIGVLQLSAQNADQRMLDSIETAAGEATQETVEQEASKAPSVDIQFTEDDRGNLVVGAPDALITIHEYSSLSCGHCATFHRDTLPQIKKDYIDDGSAKIIFHDFPLNAQAMDGSKLLRCIKSEDRYDFMNLLFEQQPQWAYGDPNYRNKLKQYAALLGISSDKADACMDDGAVQNAIIADIQAASKEYKIDSTPTFVFQPGGEVVSGALPYGEFAKRIEGMLRDQ